MAKKLPIPNLPESLPVFLHGSDKRTLILRAALRLFLEEGYSETSMDAVTAAAGVSKATVYAHFASKQILFETLIREGSASAFAEFPPLVRSGNSPEDELTAFFVPVLRHILVEGGYAWDRLMVAEALRQPEQGKLFYDCAIVRLIDVVQRYLEALHQEGLHRIPDSRSATEMLLSLVLVGPLHTLFLLGTDAIDFRKCLKLGLQLFLKGTRPD